MFDFWGPVLVEDSWCGEEFSVFFFSSSSSFFGGCVLSCCPC